MTLRGARKRAYRAVFDDKCQGQIRQDALNAKVQEATTKLESVLASMTGANVAADFKALWGQFKATRDNQIIPAIYKGNAAEAKKIADGIQSERLSKMWSIMSCKVR